MIEKDLDKFYTNEKVSKFCYDQMVKNVYLASNVLFVEPSAGSGSFLNHIEYDKIGFDIYPENDNIIKLDFLKTRSFKKYFHNDENIVIIGNPPFGKKSKLAIEFLNKSLSISDYVGFIVPLQFRKWSVQSKIDNNACLVADYDLPENAFEFKGKPYGVRCCFQIWKNFLVMNKTDVDLRLTEKPKISHDDFEMFQYNCTKEAEKYFDYTWDFAVHRQGYVDYSKKYTQASQLNKKQQWMFFKAYSQETLNILLSIDFEKLSKNNIGIPGFGKHDVITEYNKM